MSLTVPAGTYLFTSRVVVMMTGTARPFVQCHLEDAATGAGYDTTEMRIDASDGIGNLVLNAVRTLATETNVVVTCIHNGGGDREVTYDSGVFTAVGVGSLTTQ
jgi:hypothetical protein